MEQVPQVIARPHLGGVGPEEEPALYHEATVTKWSDLKKRGGRWGSNPQPLEPQSSALPIELRSPGTCCFFSIDYKYRDCQ